MSTDTLTVEFIDKEVLEVTLTVVDLAPGFEGARKLSDLEDVAISNPLDKQYLRYNETTQKWENITLDLIIENNIVFNETPSQINSKRFQTAYNYIAGTLLVHINGIKEKYITQIAPNLFEFDIDTDSEDIIEISYIKA